MRFAIYGAGSLGTVMGAFLTKNGVDIELVNRNEAHINALREHGARIVGTVEMTVPVRAILPSEMGMEYDIVFLLTKQLDNEHTVSFLKPMLGESGVIVTLQNGIPEPGIAAVVGEERTVGCVVEWGANLEGAGIARLTSDAQSLSFHMGGMRKVPKEKLMLVKSVLEKMCPVKLEDNLIGARWSKLLINATFSGIGTAIGGTFGDVCGNKLSRKLAVRCMKECIDVGRASGAEFAPVQGKDITKLFYYGNPVKRKLSELLVPIAMKKHYGIVPSMLQDIRNGKKCEIDAINGVVCEFGRRFGVETPVNDRIVEVVKMAQNGEIEPKAGNIGLFAELII